MERSYTISVFTENRPGVLHRITANLTRRKINIDSLSVSESEEKSISRCTIVVRTTPELINTIVKQIDRTVEVVAAYVSENEQLIYCEVALMRVSAASTAQRLQIEELAHRYGATVAYISDAGIVLEKSGTEDEIQALYGLFEPFGVNEFVRSGRIAIRKTPRKEQALFEEEQS